MLAEHDRTNSRAEQPGEDHIIDIDTLSRLTCSCNNKFSTSRTFEVPGSDRHQNEPHELIAKQLTLL